MALSVTDNVGAIVSKGGGVLKATERLSTGAALGSPDTVHVFGKFSSSTFRDKTPLTDRFDESGKKVATEQGDRDSGFTCTLMARDAAHIDDLRNEVRNSWYLVMKQLSQSQALSGTTTQYQFAFGQFDPYV